METQYEYQPNGDFEILYDEELKRNYFLFGYMNGHRINDSFNFGELKTVVDYLHKLSGFNKNSFNFYVIRHSRRYKFFVCGYCGLPDQMPIKDAYCMKNVEKFIHD